uniref:Uncharacterized protein n=1 Tax=Panagrolaimus sp. PS1159 TaxID=55785 RepID=A0AC35GW79_9BILA
MATKGDYCSSLKGKQDITVGDNGQYSNLNLNPNIQQKADIVFSKDVTNDNRKVSNKDFNEVNDLQTKKDSNSWNKDNNDLTFFNSQRNNSSDKKGTLKGNVSKTAANCKNSTLSLHIFAYENSNEATASDFLDGKNDRRKNESLIIKGINEKQINFDSNVVIQNPFEFPRQQEEDDKNAKPPEVMQFKASQRLLDPNDMSVIENHSSNGESTENTEED